MFCPAANRWLFIEMGQVTVGRKNAAVPLLDFLWQMAQLYNEAVSLVGLAGLVGFAFWRRFADLIYALAFGAFAAAMIPSHCKVHYQATAVRGACDGWS